jgi:hypothetical protein
MKALCMVAHPDDCVIFGYSFIYRYQKLDWTIGYLTYTEESPRGSEMAAFWRRRGIKTVFLGFEDDYADQQQQRLTRWSGNVARQRIQELAQGAELVLTHDAAGDYGHIHHQLVHNALANHENLVTFAPHGQGTNRLVIPPGVYDPSEMPTHSDIISSFHSMGHINEYVVPSTVKEFLKDH